MHFWMMYLGLAPTGQINFPIGASYVSVLITSYVPVTMEASDACEYPH